MLPEFSRSSPRWPLRTGGGFLRGGGSIHFRVALGIRPVPAAARFQAAPNVVRAAGWSPRHAPAPTPAIASAPATRRGARRCAVPHRWRHLSRSRALPWRDAPSRPATEPSTRARARSIRRPRDPALPRAHFPSPPAPALSPLLLLPQAPLAQPLPLTSPPPPLVA